MMSLRYKMERGPKFKFTIFWIISEFDEIGYDNIKGHFQEGRIWFLWQIWM